MRIRYLVLGFILFLGLSAYKLAPVFAEDGSGSAGSRPNFTFLGGTPKPSDSPRVRGLDRLEDKRLKFCQNHEGEIKIRLVSLGNLVANMLGKFDAIAQRVEDYYNNKVVPSGKTVPNYSTLVADIASKKAAVQTALTAAQSDVAGFTCTSDNPKGQLTQYRTDMQTVKKALQDYRTSIKNLIVAVRSVVGETENSPKPSEKPEATPTATP